MKAFPRSHRAALTLKQREASSTDCDSVFQLPALLSGMYHVVSAAFICSIFSVLSQQLHAELEMCRAGDAALFQCCCRHGDNMKEKRSPSVSPAARLLHKVFEVHRDLLGLESK